MRLNAFKLQESWSRDTSAAENYIVFLKQIFECNIKPLYYSIRKCRKITTTDGTMLCMIINTDINNPNKEIIAEAFINTQFLYFYQDKYWRIAVDNSRSLLYRPRIPVFEGNNMTGRALELVHYTTKILVIYPI